MGLGFRIGGFRVQGDEYLISRVMGIRVWSLGLMYNINNKNENNNEIHAYH